MSPEASVSCPQLQAVGDAALLTPAAPEPAYDTVNTELLALKLIDRNNFLQVQRSNF